MPALDAIHNAVKKAIIKDGWVITADPYVIKYAEATLYADLAAEHPIAAERAPVPGIETLAVFDETHDEYLLRNVGWHKRQRVLETFIHVRLQHDSKVWIEEDWTEAGIATDLLEAGVPREDIVLAFHPPEMRQYTEFAVA